MYHQLEHGVLLKIICKGMLRWVERNATTAATHSRGNTRKAEKGRIWRAKF